MYICPICKRGFETEDKIKRHNLACWREANPYYRSKTPPQGETVVTKTTNESVLNFFNSLKKDK